MDWREESGGGVDVEMEEDDEDGVEDKEEKSVNSNGLAVGVEAPEFDKGYDDIPKEVLDPDAKKVIV
ncbi:hypothetical protein LOK49_Contig310G00008 [Camellia lanceoleosa]|nr:hypothetical protein LOK49_Contig310G00008 [Camellia lanceoleosa]